MSTAVKIASRVRELRIHLCQVGASSKGVRDFITQHYVPIKSANPKFPILIRECSGVQPRLWARYDMGKETSVSLTNLKPAEILQQFKTITQ